VDLGIAGKRALVTGASTGLGWAAARALVDEGARVAIVSRDEERIHRAAERLAPKGAGAEVIALVGDLSHAGEPARLVSEAAAKLGGLEILVANTGGPPSGEFVDFSEDEFAQAIELILRSAERLIRAALPHLERAKWGRVVCITSIAAREPREGLALSNTLRPAVHGLTKSLARRHAAAGLTFNCVCPGFTDTQRLQELAAATAMREGTDPEEIRSRWRRDVPRGRLGLPEEVGSTIAFLCSERAAFINGVSLAVDGGQGRALL
jgi:3-oxoacyl-[acyl-carrier protein] reductase